MKYFFHHVHLLCSNLENTISFLRDHLGATLVTHKKFGGAEGATMDLNGTTINLRVAKDDEKVVNDSSLSTFGYHHICLSVDDLDAACAELTKNGVEFISAPVDAIDNRIAFFKGPDNIVVEVLQPL